MAVQFVNNPKVGDNVKIEIGNSSDLQIYHDGSNSYIKDSGTGNLVINAGSFVLNNAADTQNMIVGNDGGSVALYNAGTKKFETTSSGVKVTSEGYQINIEDSSSGNISEILTSNNAMGFFADRANSVASTSMIFSVDNTTALTIDDSQNATFAGNVTANGNYSAGQSAIIYKAQRSGGAVASDWSYDDATTDMSLGTSTSHSFSLKTGDTRALKIDTSQNVGIGETSVDARLHITTATAGLVNQKFESAGSAAWRLGIPASQTYFAFDNANDNLSSPKLIISSSGNLGIGTTSATNKLTISDNSAQILLIDTSTSNKGEIEIGDADFTFNLDRDGGISSGKFAWRIDDITRMELGLDSGDLGQLRLNEYGSGNITGTATKLLGVDENGYIIEESTSGGGTVTGTGAATRVAFWSGTSALSSDANLYWDNTNDRLGIGTTSPTVKLAVEQNVNSSASILVSNPNTGTGARSNLILTSDAARIDMYATSSTYNGVSSWTDAGVITTSSATSGGLILNAQSGDIKFQQGTSEKMRINSSGNVGIGTTSPSYRLTVNDSTANGRGIQVVQSATSGTNYGIQGGAYGSGATKNIGLSITAEGATTNDAAHFLGGNVGIGTTSPDAKLDIQGDGADFFLQSADHKIARIQPRGTGVNLDKGLFSLFNGSTESVRIDTDGNSWLNGGNVGIGLTSPSHKIDVSDSSTTWAGKILNTNLRGYGLLVRSDSTTASDLIFGAYGNGGAGAGYKMAIQADGNVGIGTISPVTALDVRGEVSVAYNATYGLRFYNNARNNWSSIGNNVASGTAANLVFKDSTGEVMRITGGEVGIGTTAPSAKLEVSGTVTISHETGSQTSPTTQLLFDNDNIDDGGGYNIDFKSSSNDTANRFMSRIQALRGSGATSSLGFFTDTGSALNRALLLDSSQNATFSGEVEVINANGLITGRSSSSANTNSSLRFMGGAYTGNKATAILYDGVSGENQLYLGGGTSLGEPATNIRFHTGSAGATGAGTERMRITSAGNVGIGTTSPGTQLHVSASGTTQASVGIGQTGTAVARLFIDASNGDFSGGDYMWIGQNNDLSGEIVMTQNSGAFHIKTQPSGTITSQLTVLQDGKVGISTTSPAEKLTVSGNANITGRFAVGIANAHPSLDFYNQGTAYFNGSTTVDDNLIVTNGRLGLGTTAPSSLLHLSAASSPTIRIVDTTNSVTLLAYAQDSNAHVGTFSNHDLIFDSNSTERMRIAAGGNVGIGTTSPSAKLHVNGTAKATKLELDESGSSTGDVSSPTGFIDVVVGGTGYIIPYFTPD